MVSAIRSVYNSAFTQAKYAAYLDELHSKHPGAIEFRVAETPIFIDRSFKNKVLDACEAIVDVIVEPSFNALTERAIATDVKVPGHSVHTHFIAFDFGICKNDSGE